MSHPSCPEAGLRVVQGGSKEKPVLSNDASPTTELCWLVPRVPSAANACEMVWDSFLWLGLSSLFPKEDRTSHLMDLKRSPALLSPELSRHFLPLGHLVGYSYFSNLSLKPGGESIRALWATQEVQLSLYIFVFILIFFFLKSPCVSLFQGMLLKEWHKRWWSLDVMAYMWTLNRIVMWCPLLSKCPLPLCAAKGLNSFPHCRHVPWVLSWNTFIPSLTFQEPCFSYIAMAFCFISSIPSLHPPLCHQAVFWLKKGAELLLLLSILWSWTYIFIF